MLRRLKYLSAKVKHIAARVMTSNRHMAVMAVKGLYDSYNLADTRADIRLETRGW